MTTGNETGARRSGGSSSAKKQRPGEAMEAFLEREAMAEKMCRIKHKILVLSGKGGVGKSTVAVNLAASLARADMRVGLLDVDIHGPSVPKLLNLEDKPIVANNEGILPVEVNGIKVISMGMLLPDKDAAVIWRGPMKMNVIKQFLKDVVWGDLDYLVIDSPPGTGDEPLTVCQLIENADGAVIVTTPQELALADVRRSVTFCRQLNLPVLGVVENMSGFVCPKCGEQVDIFKQGGGETMAAEMGVPFLGRIPLDPRIVDSGDAGQPSVLHQPDSPAAKSFLSVAHALQRRLTRDEPNASSSKS